MDNGWTWVIKRENDDIIRNLLHVLKLFEEGMDHGGSWSDIDSATSALRDAMEEIPFRKPLPWE
tara:strand:+ start:361 stop:552 length:192 start_codon:yes stop_codon:yes gene_type:complete